MLSAVHFFQWFLYEHFHNILPLYSDSLADADMAEGVPKTSSVLKIGFLYDHVCMRKF